MILANILQPLIDVFEPILVFFHDLTSSWGLAIVLLTVVIRAALLPLAIRQYRSMRALAAIAPELKKVQQKWAHDKQRQQQEVMRFYQENKVNPLASCLPLVAQLPVFIALFYLLQDDLRTEICDQTARPCEDVAAGSAQFLFIPDLTDEATGAVLVVLLVLYVGSQLLSSLLMPSTVDRTQRMVFLALPFLFIPFIVSFPAGLILYWITTNLWTVIQQVILRKVIGPPVTTVAADGTSPTSILGNLLKRGGDSGGDSEAPRANGDRASARNGAGARAGGEDGDRRERGAVSAVRASRRERGSDSAGSDGGSPSSARGAGGPPPPPPRKRKKRSGRRR